VRRQQRTFHFQHQLIFCSKFGEDIFFHLSKAPTIGSENLCQLLLIADVSLGPVITAVARQLKHPEQTVHSHRTAASFDANGHHCLHILAHAFIEKVGRTRNYHSPVLTTHESCTVLFNSAANCCIASHTHLQL
jgi:hypothetical protein